MKTEQLFEKYMKALIEQDEQEPVDAADVAEQPAAEQPPATETEVLTSEGEKFLIELVVKAFLHKPDETEANIVKELQATLLKDRPKDVLENIKNMLEISLVDTKTSLGLTTDINS